MMKASKKFFYTTTCVERIRYFLLVVVILYSLYSIFFVKPEAGAVQAFVAISSSPPPTTIRTTTTHHNHIRLDHLNSRCCSTTSRCYAFGGGNNKNNNNNNDDKIEIDDYKATKEEIQGTAASAATTTAAADDGNEDDFGNWVTNLKQWPMRSETSSGAAAKNGDVLQAAELNDKRRSSSSSQKESDISSTLSATPTAKNGETTSVTGFDDPFSSFSRILNIETLLQIGNNENNNNINNNNNDGEQQKNIVLNATNTVNTTITSNSIPILDLGALLELSSIGGAVTGTFLRETTKRIESIVNEASTAVSPETIQALVRQSTYTLSTIEDAKTGKKTIKTSSSSQKQLSSANTTTTSSPNDLVAAATKIAIERGLDVTEAADRARETAAYASSLLQVADGLLRKGYVKGDSLPQSQAKSNPNILREVPTIDGSKALFDDFSSVYELDTYTPSLAKGAEMGALAGAIYEEKVSNARNLGHSLVAEGVTQDVAWMVTDSIATPSSFSENNIVNENENDDKSKTSSSGKKKDSGDGNTEKNKPFLVRTITIRGYDASDENVDRELLLNRVVNGTSTKLIRSRRIRSGTVAVHSGLLEIAREIYKDVKKYIEWTGPQDKIVLNGHSIGGSLSLLILFIMAQEKGSEFVRKKIKKVYTFGCPPIVTIERNPNVKNPEGVIRNDYCEVLDAFDLPSSLVHAYIQPWDPIIRLFSEIDALYPLVGDVGDDGLTLWASGPRRTLRPITKAIAEAWNGWPRFRDVFQKGASQTYQAVGIQHVVLPDPTRYLADRFISANIPVPPVATIVRISPSELYAAMEAVFPLDVFEVSFIPQAIRSFVHHFFPAYGFPLVDYVKELERRSRGLPERAGRYSFSPEDMDTDGTPSTTMPEEAKADAKNQEPGGIDWKKATQWLTG